MSRFADKSSRYLDEATASLDVKAAEWIEDWEGWEARRQGSLTRARARIAGETGLSEGQLERIRRKRLKGIRGYVVEKIRAAFVAAIAREQQRLAHALWLAETGGRELAPDAAREARAALGEARQLIDEAARRA